MVSESLLNGNSNTSLSLTVAASVAMPRQFQRFARKSLIEYPPATPSADTLGEVEADDSFRYYIKDDQNGKLIRASEWLSTHIAEEVHITAPSPMIIELMDGRKVFGSRCVSGVADGLITSDFLMSPTIRKNISPIPTLCSILSSIYALDMFLYNDDRHFGNYLSTEDHGVRRIYAFDFSRALFWQWPWINYPPLDCNTRRFGAVLRQNHGFDVGSASATLDRLCDLTALTLEGFINRMPEDWLTPGIKTEFMTWWRSKERSGRVETLKKGFNDGTLL